MKSRILISLILMLLGYGRSVAERRFVSRPQEPVALPAGRVAAVEARWSVRALPPASGMAGYESALRLGPEVRISLTPGSEGVNEPLSQSTQCYRVGVWLRDSLVASADVADGAFLYGRGVHNALGVEWGSDGRAAVYGGGDRLTQILTLDALPRPDSVWVEAVNTSASTDYIVADLLPPNPAAQWPLFAGDDLPDPSSADLRAARWEYLDRENSPASAVVGGKYRLATVADPNGGYWIVYQAGATTAPQLWAPGRVKGRLSPTGFVDHFNLQWLDSEGRLVNDEAYADFDAARAILTLNFPLLNAKVRFSRVP